MAPQRRLAAILFTDMVDFTRGAQVDERATLNRLTEQEAIVKPLLVRDQGRWVKSTGDGSLVEFSSALKATECAVAIQQALRDRNLRVGGPPIELRIGIHLGDVEDRDGDILGDAVNLAARIQGTAPPGGVVVSQQVYDQVRNKTSCPFEALPSRNLKGVEVAIPIYRLVLPWDRPASRGVPADARSGRLAVLPFANISPDPRDAYFSDGLTEEVISVLSELGGLRVIARTSIEPYRTNPRPVAQVGDELGVQWVLEGSVRRDGPRLRFTAQLIDARSQEHLWAGRYDRDLNEIFALQTELAKQVANALEVQLRPPEAARLAERYVPRSDSYLQYLEGRARLRQISEASLRQAKAHFEQAIALDERNGQAYAGLAQAQGLLAGAHRTISLREAIDETRRLTNRALEFDPNLAEAHALLGSSFADDYRYAAAFPELRRAIELNPSSSVAHFCYGMALADVGKPDDALIEYDLAEQLDPLSSLLVAETVDLYTLLGRFAEARTKLKRLGEVEGEGLLFHDRRGGLALSTGDLEGFQREVTEWESRFPSRPEIVLVRAASLWASGDPEAARRSLPPIESLAPADRPTGQLALVYALLGDSDKTFYWINQAIDERRFAPRYWLYDARYAALRKDPRFAEVLKRTRVD